MNNENTEFKFSKDDYWEIWQIAHKKYLELAYSSDNQDLHLAKVYSEAVLTYLKYKGYEVKKK